MKQRLMISHDTPLSLDCLTLPDVGPVELVQIAAKAGFSYVSLWVQEPSLWPSMLAVPAMKRDLVQVMVDTSVALANLEIYNLNIDAPIADYERSLAFGAELGARCATAINYGNPRSDIAERLVEFRNLCRRHGLETYLEPISVGQTRTLQDAVELIESAGVEARLVVDCLHLIRTGGSAETVAHVPADYIGYVQLCDGPLLLAQNSELGAEATESRLYPGEGQFPLMEILRCVSSKPIIGVETPNKARQEQGMSPLDRAQAARRATMDILTKVEAASGGI